METYNERLRSVTDWVEDNISTVEEFALMFDIAVEDMVKCFPDAMVKKYKTVFPPDVEDTLEDDDEEEAWSYFGISDEEDN